MNPSRSLLALAATSLLSVGLIACGGDDETTSSGAATSSTTTEQPTTTAEDSGGRTETTPPPEDEGDVITVKGGQPDGGPKKLKASTGDEVKITVDSDQEVNVHLHGYDIEKAAKPGEPAEFEFKADIPGIFTIEIEDTGTEIGELEVS